MNTKSSGTVANENGLTLEDFIENSLVRKGYKLIDKNKFDAAQYLKQPIYSKQYLVGQSIYENDMFCDFILYHPEKYPVCLVIESKWQQSGGSVDEKFPYLVLNIKAQTPYKTVVILDGGGYKANAAKWLRNQVDDMLIHVFDMAEFQKWVNKNGV